MADKDFAYHIIKDPGTVTARTSGLASAPVLESTGLSSIDDAFGTYLLHSTPTALNSAAGLLTGLNVVAAGWRPAIEFEVKAPSDTSNLRLWIGLFSVRPDLLNPGALSTQHVAAFYFGPDGGPSVDPTKWRGVTNDGSTMQDLETPAVVTPSKLYRLRLEIVGGSSTAPPNEVRFFVNNDTSSTTVISSFPPGLSTLLGIAIRATNLTTTGTVSKQVLWNRVSWRYNVRAI